MRHFRFNEADLQANQDGRISNAQRERYMPPRFQGLVMIVILGHAALLAGLLGLIALISQQPLMLLVLAVVLGMALLPFTLARADNLQRPVVLQDIHAGRVTSVCGPVLLDSQDKTSYTLLVSGEPFTLSRDAYFALRPGFEYCFYYLPNSRTILSVAIV